MMNTIVANSWAELNELMFEGYNEPLKRFRSNFAFRGLPRAEYDLKTSLIRLKIPEGQLPEIERHLLRNFRKYSHHSVVPFESEWNWLAVAQHHGLPTRLIDWTYSPYVALHFATHRIDDFNCDAAIWCVDYVQASAFMPQKLREILKQEGSNVFTVSMLEAAAQRLHDFDTLSDEPFVVFLEPPSLDERIVNQFALFSLMSSSLTALDRWLADKPELYRKIIIPARLKWEVRDKLDQANITERVLFPGLDGLSSWLRRYYSPVP
jgi:hypothetical protein